MTTILIIIGVVAAIAIGIIVAFVVRVGRMEDTAEWYRKEHEGHARAQRPDKWQ